MTNETPMHLVVDLEKGTQTYVPYTAEEIQQRELDSIAYATFQAERETAIAAHAALVESAKSKLTAGEPLTEEEAAVLVI